MIIPNQNFNVITIEITMEGKIRITATSIEVISTDGCVRQEFLVDYHACSIICQIFMQSEIAIPWILIATTEIELISW